MNKMIKMVHLQMISLWKMVIFHMGNSPTNRGQSLAPKHLLVGVDGGEARKPLMILVPSLTEVDLWWLPTDFHDGSKSLATKKTDD